MVLVIEDAHWADRSTRDLLAFLIRNQRALDGLLIIVIYRSDELHRTHPLRPLLAELDRISWVARMELRRLSRPDTASWSPGSPAASPARPADARLPAHRGQPAVRGGAAQRRRAGPGLPESLRDLLLAGVRRLPEDTQELLRVASAAASGSGTRCWPRSPGRTTPGWPARCGPR